MLDGEGLDLLDMCMCMCTRMEAPEMCPRCARDVPEMCPRCARGAVLACGRLRVARPRGREEGEKACSGRLGAGVGGGGGVVARLEPDDPRAVERRVLVVLEHEPSGQVLVQVGAARVISGDLG